MRTLSVLLLVAVAFCIAEEVLEKRLGIEKLNLSGSLKAGAAKVDGSLPVGVPLAGFNHGARRVPLYPIPELKQYTTWMTPSLGYLNPTWVKSLILDDGTTRIQFVTIDGIGADGALARLAYDIAVNMGLTTAWENVILSGSHSHSGPGAISPEFLWQVAPATDLIVPELQQQLAESLAKAMVEAQDNLAPAQIGTDIGYLTGVTRNRRGGWSPWLKPDSIDPNIGVLRVDDAKGNPVATLWNFAIHGICYGPDNLYISSDIMGGACDIIEKNVGGIALFVNADAGDIDPADGMCQGTPFVGSVKMAQAVQTTRQNIQTSSDVTITVAAKVVEFGPTDLNFTLQRFDNCTSGGPLDICSLCELLRCELNAHMPSSWIENAPKFTAVRLDILGETTVLVTMPGEPLLELGWWVRNDTLDMGFNKTFLAGYSNSHMGYFATPNEYDWGGYESQMTFWGITTAEQIRDGAKSVAELVKPTKTAKAKIMLNEDVPQPIRD